MTEEPQRQPQQQLQIVFLPPLVALLHRAEQLKTQPLTEAEVLTIRDNAVAMTVSPQVAAQMEAERGYADIDAQNCWQAWQQARVHLAAPPQEPQTP